MTYTPKLKPYDHQFAAVDKCNGAGAFAYLMEMGSGKSSALQLDWGRLYDANEVKDLLVLAPAGVYRNWEGELRTHLDPAVYDSARVFTWRAGGGVTYKRDLERFLSKPDPKSPRIFLANTESFQVDTGLEAATKMFLKGDRAMVAIDESTAIKNPMAKRTKKIVSLKYHAPYRRILAGLPNPKSPLDLFSQFEFLDRRILGHENFYTFRSEFCTVRRIEMRGPGGVPILNKDGTPKKRPEIVGFRNLDKLKALVASASFRVTKDECLDLPEKIFMPLREVRLHPEQKRIYEEIRDNATAQLSDGSNVTTQQVITQLLRLQQVLCGHVVDENGVAHDIPEYRTDALVEDLDAVGGKAIIWAVYRHSIQKIVQRVEREFGKGSIVSYYGDTSSDDRQRAIDRFQNDQDCLFFIGNQQTAGRGITLTAARGVIYYANSPDLELRLQSEDRAHRAGLKHPVAYSDLHVPGTVDERWVRALRKKIDVATAVLGDGPKAWLI